MDWVAGLRDRVESHGATFGQGALPEQIARLERDLGVALPPSYVLFLSVFGWFEDDQVKVLGITSSESEGYLDVLEELRWEREEAAISIPPCVIPVSDDGAGNLFCIHTDGQSAGEIVLLGAHRACSFEMEAVAPSFDAFLIGQLAGGP